MPATTATRTTPTLRHRWHTALLAPALAAMLTGGAGAETGTLDADGVPLHVVDAGEGPAVIYLHGFAGSADMWSATGLLPLDGFRTLAFDARGHGLSGKPETAEAYGTALVDDILRLMADRGVESAHLVGYSMGAETALKFATEHPDRVLSLTVAGSGWSGAAEAEGYAYIATALAEAPDFGTFMAMMTPPDQPELSPDAQAAMGQLLATHGIDPAQPAAPLAAVAESLPALLALDAETIAALDMPLLAIAGADDPERPNIEALATPLPGAEIVVIPDADHLTAPVDPAFAATVAGFLAAQ